MLSKDILRHNNHSRNRHSLKRIIMILLLDQENLPYFGTEERKQSALIQETYQVKLFPVNVIFPDAF